jgi:glutamate-1-semialdehyde 2,1-aminomutase
MCPDADYGSADAPNSVPDTGGIPDNRMEETIVLTQNDYEGTEKLLREHADELAGVFLEPMAASGGLVVLEKEYLQMLRDLTKELGIVLVYDETVTIRNARGGYQSVVGVIPDLTITGKTIGGGLPIGAIGGSKEVMAVYEDGRTGISGTHHGHRLSCAAGIAMLNEMDDAAYAHLNGLADRIKTELTDWAAEKKIPFHVYGEGSVLMYMFTKELGQTIHTQRDIWKYQDEEMMDIYSLEIATRGYLPVARGQIAMTLPMTDDDITGYIETTKAVISEMYE